MLIKCCFILLACCQISLQHDNYLDEWAVHLVGGYKHAKEFAKKHDLELIDKIGTLKNYYVFKLAHHRKKRMINEDDFNQFELQLRQHRNVRWLERQRKIRRVKRDFINKPTEVKQINSLQDPLWDKTWYLNGNNKNLPDMNVTGAWKLGFTGKGVSVTFLDDGLEHNHPDIQQNYDPKASTDINNHDNDPMPRYDPTNENKHGTRCAGEVGAVANNNICSVGVAYNAGVGGIRMLDGDISDSVEAASLSFNNQHIDIYSASWGPDDNGEVVDGPGPLAKKAFVEGITKGRGGKGSIFVWASGNGGRYGDSCSCDGYANSIYTLSISSTSEKSDKPWYLEECTSTLATTYSSGDEKSGERDVITTDINHKCTEKHTGTSAAAPLAAGIIALALEANPTLTWRDVMFLIVLTSRPKAIKSNNFIQNKQGFLVSNAYGFGLMDAGRMVELARNWKNVPKMNSCSTRNLKYKPNTTEQALNHIESILFTDSCEDSSDEVNYIEQVEAIVTIKTSQRGALEIYLTSPSGTRTLLLPRRPADKYSDGFNNWSFMSVQLWGESPKGYWKLEILPREGVDADLVRFDLNIHGTKEEPINYRSLLGFDSHNVSRIRHIKAQISSASSTLNTNTASTVLFLNNLHLMTLMITILTSKLLLCHPECAPDSRTCGPTEYDCQSCLHYSLKTIDNRIQCVPYCPIGYYSDDLQHTCLKCHSNCYECDGPKETHCKSCSNKLLKLDTHECVDECPISEGYFKTKDYECKLCKTGCSECLIEENFCPKCSQKVTLNGSTVSFTNINNFCLPNYRNSCEPHTYFDERTNECESCDIACLECTGPLMDDCIKCPDKRPYLQANKCVRSCSDGYYLNETALRCFECNSNCEKCIYNSTYCLSCKSGYTINFKSKDNFCSMVIQYDDKCHETCYECFGPQSDQCRHCKNDLVLYENKCIKNAPPGFFKIKRPNNNGVLVNVFEKCSVNCLSCTNETHCTNCDQDYLLLNGRCHKKCTQFEYTNKDGDCSKCVAPCSKCINETFCTACLADKFYLNGNCFNVCPIGYFGQNGQCLACHWSCKQCKGSDSSSCLTCANGFSFKNGICRSNCPSGTFLDASISQCSLCNTTICLECTENPNKCVKCQAPLVLDIPSFSCKSCCSRNIHGKIKTEGCCNCPIVNPDNICSNGNQTDSSTDYSFNNHTKVKIKEEPAASQLLNFTAFVLIILSTIVSIIALKRLKAVWKKRKSLNKSIRYRPLDTNEEDANLKEIRFDNVFD